MTSATDFNGWEQQATRTLNVTRHLVDALRSAPNPQSEDILQKRGEHHIQHVQANDDKFSLIAHLRSEGVFDQVHELNGLVVNASLLDQGVSTDDLPHSRQAGDERHLILNLIVFPLLTHLYECYKILDNAPQSPPSKPKNKPQPTKGMLSLNDYTNVACLLEFAVCSSLLPQLGYYPFWDEGKVIDRSNAKLMVQKRVRSLPKSLAGRISCQTLGWGVDSAADAWSQQQTDESLAMKINLMHQNCLELTRLIITLGRLVLLDRFRPMLLPRHLADLYMTMLFLERCKWNLVRLIKSCESQFDDAQNNISLKEMKKISMGEDKTLHRLQVALLFTPLRTRLTTPIRNLTDEMESRRIDHREAALAFRTLLGGEAAVVMTSPTTNANQKNSFVLMIPQWLRMRLGQCLTRLAADDLHAVVDVFVASARGMGSESSQQDDDVMTGAAARLARALCAKPSSGSESTNEAIKFQESLCNQFIDFLVAEGKAVYKALIDGNEMSKSDAIGRKLSRSCMAMLYTLWATIGQLPEEVLQSYFVSRLCSGLTPLNQDDMSADTCLTSLQSAMSIWIWLSTAPSSLDPSTVKKMHSILLTNNVPENQLCMLSQLLRLAASFRHDIGQSKPVVEMNQHFHSSNAAQQMADIALNQVVLSLIKEETHLHSVALEIVRAVATNQFDAKGYCFRPAQTYDTHGPEALRSPVYTSGPSNSNPTLLLQEVEQRARIMIDVVIAPLSSKAENVLAGNERSGEMDQISSLPSTLFRLVLMFHFYASYSVIDSGKQNNTMHSKMTDYGLTGVFERDFDTYHIAATVLLGFLCDKCSPSTILMSNSNTDILELLGIVIDCAALQLDEEYIVRDSTVCSEVFSTASIVVSLLISLLELGAKKRTDQDEDILQSMLPSLQILSSSLPHNTHHNQIEQDPETPSLSVQLAELAEMSSHAMALIVSRKIEHSADETEQDQAAETTKAGTEWISQQFAKAEHDLSSSQPPLRARAVVSLRHLARSLNSDGIDVDEKKCMVSEVEPLNLQDEKKPVTNEMITRSLARVCFISLSDPESYVYLAGIQTLVVICDVCPAEILPMTATLVAKGISDFPILASKAKVSSVSLSLDPEQRIKAGEALTFMIRRRSKGIYLYGQLLLDLMVYGSKQSHPNLQRKYKISDDISRNIQVQTHTYFIGSDEDEANDGERQVRVNTGGPVFEMEEDDLLRATSISVVCELVAVLTPSVVASYCHILVRLVIDALQLEDSRPIRRAAALLSRELYASVETELAQPDDVSPTVYMAVAMVCSGEDKLHHLLHSCTSENSRNISNAKALHIDIATQSRCKEALAIRKHLDSLSVFDAAALIADSMKVESEPIVKAVQGALSRTVA